MPLLAMSAHARSLLGLGSGLRRPTAVSRLSSIKVRIIAPVFGSVCLEPPLGVPSTMHFPVNNTENWTLCCHSSKARYFLVRPQDSRFLKTVLSLTSFKLR
ncbi:hypothetical protein B0H11DRAFT_1924566 [Mycena galericulata]|nr:hypothetical protein B0H11DRAFT_1924563 [Mycena galericulata]KAJ7458761.1 hypothetical protein B0H11DRAFT_1924566 [Mycena galericulata]